MTLTVGSLFSGIGGLDLGLERAGMEVIWQSEIDPFASKVLKKHWPKVNNYGDITKINWDTIPKPDVICGGYPCQPFSLAGHRNGTNDPRHLWPYVKDAISRLRPRYAIMENVRGHLSLGGLSVIGDLASIGYDAEWRVVSAAAVGASHLRHRLFIVAYPTNINVETPKVLWDATQSPRQPRRKTWADVSRTQWEVHQPSMVGVADDVSDRVDRVKAIGNAVVPQVAEVIGHLVMNHAGLHETKNL